VILIDSNIPMYLVGADDAWRERAQRSLENVVISGEPLVTDAEVFQELLHRYHHAGRVDAIDPAFAALRGLVDETFPIEARDVDRARRLVLSTPRLSARDALHVAVMQGHDVERILSFDRGFDGLPGIVRVGE
jgi:predicted nucleic acid-binding protein